VAIARVPDKFECYELCVQSPRHVVAFLRGVHGERPTVLREDFCGTAAFSRRWVREALTRGELCRSVAVDCDAATIARAHEMAIAMGCEDGVEFRMHDAVRAEPTTMDGCDVVFVGNFSIGYIHSRTDLVRYFQRSRERLAMSNAGFGGGIFVCDTYGGAGAFTLGGIQRVHQSKGHHRVHYAWQHEAADAMTGMVRNSISFRVELEGEIIAELPRVFVYEWRLWSIAELREAMAEAGFRRSAVYKEISLAPNETPSPIVRPQDLGDDWVVLIAAWA
jgi:hypothetical protein